MLLKSKELVKQIDQQISDAVKNVKETDQYQHTENYVGDLAIVEVGADPASRVYIKQKLRKAKKLGITAVPYYLPEDISQESLETQLDQLNQTFSAIILQAPIPDHLNFEQAVTHILPSRDADGLNPLNQSELLINPKGHYPIACTPQGICLWILSITQADSLEDAVSGKRVLIFGRSHLVGMPLASLLQGAGATVTVRHSHSPELQADELKQYDIIIAAAGKHHMLNTADMADGTIVIDVGIHEIKDDTKKSGHRFEGDIEINDSDLHRLDVTAVPGGVGPLTVEMLMLQTVTLMSARFNVHKNKPYDEPISTVTLAASKTAHQIKNKIDYGW